MKKIITFLLLFYSSLGILYAQTATCAFDSLKAWNDTTVSNWMERKAHENRIIYYRSHPKSQFRSASGGGGGGQQIVASGNPTIYVIPVVFHIDTLNIPVTITDFRVQNQLDALNAAFHPYNIQFCFAQKKPNGTSFNGINRIGSSSINNRLGLQQSTLTNVSYYNPEQYLNVYIVKEILAADGSATTYDGYDNIMPGMRGLDLIVLRYDKLGDSATCSNCPGLANISRGKVLAHEVGHYLGLYHTYDGGCSAGNTGQTCGKAGDLCCDTRPGLQNNSCPIPSINNCSYHLTINENYDNYMNYTPEPCQFAFTQDQTDIMHKVLENIRFSLVSPENINYQNLSCSLSSPWFAASPTQVCGNDSINLTGLQYSGTIRYRWMIYNNSNVKVYDQTFLNISSKKIALSVDGKYDVVLQLIYSGSNDTLELKRAQLIERVNCGTLLPSSQANWIFGDRAALQFTTTGVFRGLGPYFTFPNINTSEGTITQSSANGKLLFYGGSNTYGIKDFRIYDTAFKLIDTIIGDASAYQAGLSIPMPGNPSQYYIVCASGNELMPQLQNGFTDLRGLRYSIFDTTLNGNKGGLLLAFKDVPLKVPSGSEFSLYDSAFYCGEHQTAIPQCNGSDYWLVTADQSAGSTYSNWKKIVVFSVTSAGISYHYTLNNQINNGNGGGMIKASPDGNWIAAPGLLLRFDNSTGIPTFYKNIPFGTDITSYSFSPDSKLLYALYRGPNDYADLAQLNLYSSDTALSRVQVSIGEYPFNMELQIAPDNKIYVSTYVQPYVSVINKPNELSSISFPNECEFVEQGPILSSGGVGGFSRIGLPNMIDAKKAGEIALDFHFRDSACGYVKFFPNKYCITGYRWFFGTGDSSNLREPLYHFVSDGQYNVMVINGTDTVRNTVNIGIDAPIIAGTFIVCDTFLTYNYTVQNKNSFYEYQWSTLGGNSTLLPSGEFDVQWTGNGGSVKVKVIDKTRGCRDSSIQNVIPYVKNNFIATTTGHCKLITASTPITADDSTYQWFTSKDSLTWDTIAGATSLNYTPELYYTVKFYRRTVKVASCLHLSNVVRIAPQIIFTAQPQDTFICYSNINNGVQFFCAATATNGDYVHYRWKSHPSDTNQYSLINNAYAIGESVRCKVSTTCGFGYSDYAKFNVSYPQAIIQDPRDTTAFTGDSTVFRCQTWFNGTGYPNFNPSLSWYNKFIWQESNDGINFYSLDTTVDTFYVVKPVEICHRNHYFRVVVSNTCNNSVISNKAQLRVLDTSDVWMRDSPTDSGIEPNFTAGDIWASPDLWVHWKPNEHYSVPNDLEYTTTDSNYIWVRIRNRGTKLSSPTKLYLYWTKLSTGERWKEDWTASTSNTIQDRYDPNITHLLGEQINNDPIMIPGLWPGDTYYKKYGWFPPDPAWYYHVMGVNNQDTVDETAINVCLLARIEQCDSFPHGMTNPETDTIEYNVRYNNNIVTRNMVIRNIPGGLMKTSGTDWAWIRNTRKSPKYVDVKIVPISSSGFFSYGKMLLRLDNDLVDKWNVTGSNGTGYSVINSNTLEVTTDDEVWLYNISLDSAQAVTIGVQFILDSNATIASPASYNFEMYQYTDDALVEDGGVVFQVNVDTVTSIRIDSIAPLCQNGTPVVLTGWPLGGQWFGAADVNGVVNPGLLGPGTHTANYIWRNGGNVFQDNFNIKVWANLSVSVVSTGAECWPGNVNLNANVTGGGGNYKYLWPHNIATTSSVVVTANGSYIVSAKENCSNCSFTDTIVVNNPPCGEGGDPAQEQTGLTEGDENSVNIFPNPANDVIYIIMSGASIYKVRITEMSGKTLIDQTSAPSTHVLSINTEGLKAGIYIVEVVNDQHTTTRARVVILK